MRDCGIFLLSLVCLACDRTDMPDHDRSRLAELSADSLFYSVERQLLESEETTLDFHITAEGTFRADLTGNLRFGTGNRVDLSATGTFGNDPVDLRLVSDGAVMRYGNGGETETPTPTALTEAIAVGMMRMGLLHNLARLVANAPPDHADGSVMEWVTVRDLRRLEDTEEELGVEFALVVEGVESGNAILRVDEETGETIIREQTVRFPDGEMRVVERYGS